MQLVGRIGQFYIFSYKYKIWIELDKRSVFSGTQATLWAKSENPKFFGFEKKLRPSRLTEDELKFGLMKFGNLGTISILIFLGKVQNITCMLVLQST